MRTQHSLQKGKLLGCQRDSEIYWSADVAAAETKEMKELIDRRRTPGDEVGGTQRVASDNFRSKSLYKRF